jgi:transposase-like protein
MRTTERENYWRRIVGRQEKSGLSVKAFCRQEDLCAHTLYIWRRRLGKRQPVNFAVVKVTPEAAPATTPLHLILSSGDCLQIPAGFDAGTLRTVLAALRERA